ncbi:Fe-S cluster assembly protein SufB [Patulibacter defluvii]|uniref:Fe-S cluster assembly protein SufB n=1 Tax=Patulibacter defluvii TaxID=3095358 RepID=UPI002A75C043|nr:Fe-S cluster assembly protein SufB [Patulibacter sp. DM4]
MPTPPETSASLLNEEEAALKDLNADYTAKYGFHDAENYLYKAPKGINREIVEKISEFKDEPQWMREFRLKSLEHFEARPQPTWGSPMLAEVDYDDIHYFVRASEKASRTWDEVPEDVKNTFDRLGIPEAERKFLAGVGAQYESEVVYHQVNEELEKQGVIFLDMDTALREHEDLVREYFATVIPPNDNKLAALNSSVWSGGSFVYVPPGVHVEMPLQAYFRINTENMGQFERTLIIADEGSYVHYVEGCTAPTYSSSSLHSAVVELIAKPGARIRYTTVQNWSQNVFNLVTKRAIAQQDATVEWVDCNLGSKLTMKYPAVYLMGERAHGEVLSIAFAGNGQHQDAGAKIVHAAPNTTSNIFAKSISKDGGRSSYRGLLEVGKGAVGSKSKVVCDALLLDERSKTDTWPTIRIDEDQVDIGHEATVSKVGEEQLFYLQSHGLPEDEAAKLIVNGFIEPIVKELPMEYAVEMNRLIELQMEGSIG